METSQRQPPAKAPGAGRFARYGAAGFGLGGALCGVLEAFLTTYTAESQPLASCVVSLGFGLMGILGGAALGLAARDARLLRRLLLAGLIGFGPGGLIGLLLVATLQVDPAALHLVFRADPSAGFGVFTLAGLLYGIAFGVRGALGGAVLGLAVPHRHAVRVLSVMGFLGFAAGGVVSMVLLNLAGAAVLLLGLLGVDIVWQAGTATVGGAVLGTGLWILLRGRGLS